MVTVTVDLTKCKDLSELTQETKKKGMENTAKDLINNLMRNSPRDHGLLAGWAIESQTDDEITIKSPAYYAGWVNYGHPQQPGRFIPGEWKGDKFKYIPKHKTGMVLKASFVEGKHFVEKSIEQTQARIAEFFTINGG